MAGRSFASRRGNGIGRHESIIDRAKRIYAEQLRAVLEPQHRDRFAAIERNLASISWGYVRRGRELGQGEAPIPAVAHHSDRASRRLPHEGYAAVNALVDDQLGLRRVPVVPSRNGHARTSWRGSTRRLTVGWQYRGSRSPNWGCRGSRPPRRSWRTADPWSSKHSPASLIGSARPTRRRSPPAMGSTRSSERCCWMAVGWTSPGAKTVELT